jgi:iron complex transport system substrate-binding protein
VVASIALAAVLAGCGDDDASGVATVPATTRPAATSAPADPAPADTAPTDTVPVVTEAAPVEDSRIAVVDARGEEVVIESTERIMPVDGDLAEVVWALGLGDRVVATDISATYPAEADASPKIGYQRALSPEPILEFEPTVVLATELTGPPETLDQLERLGVPVVIVPKPPTAEGPLVKIRAIAEALGVPERGEELAAEVEREMADATSTLDPTAEPVRIAALYVRGENVQLLLGEESGIGWIIDAVGGVNVADELGVVDAEPITAEALLQVAPEAIVVPASGLESVGGVDGLLQIGGLGETPAGQQRRVLAYDDQFLLGNGPRSGQLLTAMIADLHGATS